MELKTFTFNPFQENTYLLWDDSGICWIFDPGCSNRAEEKQLTHFIEDKNLSPQAIINTHCHVDHVLGNYFLQQKYGIPLYIPKGERDLLRSVQTYAPMYGVMDYQEAEPDGYLDSDSGIDFNDEEYKILFLPGHSPGHLGFYFPKDAFILSGDVLFHQSIGRTDLPGGDHETLIKSIQEKLFELPENTTVYCGHGPETQIGFEKKNNPFCALP